MNDSTEQASMRSKSLDTPISAKQTLPDPTKSEHVTAQEKPCTEPTTFHRQDSDGSLPKSQQTHAEDKDLGIPESRSFDSDKGTTTKGDKRTRDRPGSCGPASTTTVMASKHTESLKSVVTSKVKESIMSYFQPAGDKVRTGN